MEYEILFLLASPNFTNTHSVRNSKSRALVNLLDIPKI